MAAQGLVKVTGCYGDAAILGESSKVIATWPAHLFKKRWRLNKLNRNSGETSNFQTIYGDNLWY